MKLIHRQIGVVLLCALILGIIVLFSDFWPGSTLARVVAGLGFLVLVYLSIRKWQYPTEAEKKKAP
jgi:hypothetical protein